MPDTHEISDDESLYRKVPISPNWYNQESNELSPDAFNPRRGDETGISLERAQSTEHPEFRTIEQAAQGPSPKGYYVAVLRVGDLRGAGLNVVADPDVGRGVPGHVLITDLTYDNRKTPESEEKKILLAHELVLKVEGPFPLA